MHLTGCSPVDVSSREKGVADRLERDREANLEKLAMSRSNSRTGTDRNSVPRPQTPPAPAQSKLSSSTQTWGPTLTPTVRPSLSFANVAAKKESVASRTFEERDSNSNEEESTEIDTKVVS
jgi:translation initiation factor 4B